MRQLKWIISEELLITASFTCTLASTAHRCFSNARRLAASSRSRSLSSTATSSTSTCRWPLCSRMKHASHIDRSQSRQKTVTSRSTCWSHRFPASVLDVFGLRWSVLRGDSPAAVATESHVSNLPTGYGPHPSAVVSAEYGSSDPGSFSDTERASPASPQALHSSPDPERSSAGICCSWSRAST